MKRWIRLNSEIETYRGIKIGLEEGGDQRYYFIDKWGGKHYAELEEELRAQIDDYLDSNKTSVNAADCIVPGVYTAKGADGNLYVTSMPATSVKEALESGFIPVDSETGQEVSGLNTREIYEMWADGLIDLVI